MLGGGVMLADIGGGDASADLIFEVFDCADRVRTGGGVAGAPSTERVVAMANSSNVKRTRTE